MADHHNSKSIHLLKNTRITVFVDEALEDMLVVTYEFGIKIYKGILLDFKKRNLPHGISNLNPALAPPNLDDDLLYSVNQRFTYTDPNQPKPKNVRMPSKYKHTKMTVRLRPRQVLCSKCKGICNENSENVSKKRKSQDTIQIPPKRSADAPITRSVYTEQLSKTKIQKQTLQPSLIPKIPRLLPHEISNALNGNLEKLCDKKKEEISVKEDNEGDAEQLSDNTCDVGTPNLRKKRVNSTEETIKENGVEDKQTDVIVSQNNVQCVNTRTIKISFGPQGEGTVLKIPAPIDNFKNSTVIEQNVTIVKESDSKAARKALRRARKKARQKSLLTGHSPNQIVMSPRYSLGGISPRYSPRYIASIEMPKRRKHKVKRKRKHKDEKDCKDSTENSTAVQKLSINLKRIQDSYVTSNVSDKGEDKTSNVTSSVSDKGEENSSSSDEHSEKIPNFPPPHSPLILRINAQNISSGFGSDGRPLLTGDIVWGKIHGFPWWPGKILSITCTENQNPHAHVSWYGSSTSSHIKCDQLSQFLDNFKARHNKKKRGPYKEAVRQATIDARGSSTTRIRKNTIINSPSQSILNVPRPALASPREINVMS